MADPQPWQIWTVKMSPHVHPAVVLLAQDNRFAVVPITTDDTFATVARRVEINEEDDDFAVTGLRETSYICPEGLIIVKREAFVVDHQRYLPEMYQGELQTLLKRPEIAAHVRKMWSER